MKNYVGSLIALTLLFGLSVAAKAEGRARDHRKVALRFCGQRKGTSRRYIHGESIVVRSARCT